MLSVVDESVELERKNKTVDIVKRVGVITADKVHFTNHPAENPVTIFNPTILIKNDDLKVYGRIVLGYFTYASAILELTVPIDELDEVSKGRYRGRICIKPDNEYDIWGAEDPRASIVKGKRVITYCGRTVNYFRPGIERVLPIVAVSENRDWKKVCVFKFSGQNIVSDKDAFLADINGLKFFHRIHTVNDEFHCVINEISDKTLDRSELTESLISNVKIWLKHASFEEKIGWSSPAVKVGKKYLLLLHGVDKNTKWYKVFAALMDERAKITAVTRHYIMEPRESYEVYGDRPFTVFPCGACKLDDKLLVSYGAADFAAGIGEIDLTELMSMLDSNRI